MLLPAKVDPVTEKQVYKADALVASGTGYIELIFTLLVKVVVLYR